MTLVKISVSGPNNSSDGPRSRNRSKTTEENKDGKERLEKSFELRMNLDRIMC